MLTYADKMCERNSNIVSTICNDSFSVHYPNFKQLIFLNKMNISLKMRHYISHRS